ncbi:MAG TPA: ATP-dependent DNA helicase RecG [Chitinophagales bacterium]|nr:ATP-dependent DNA helicase RecG [Chitinophagales bacterium]
MAQIQHLLSSPIEYLKGVGPQRAELLRKELNISTFDDLLQHFPFRYVDRTQFVKIKQINANSLFVQFIGKLVEKNVEGIGRTARLKAYITDGTGEIELVWFQGQRWIDKMLEVGKTYIIFGRPNYYRGEYSIPHPEISLLDEASKEDLKKPGLQPVYPSTEKLKSRNLHSRGIEKLVKTLFSLVNEKDVPENLPEEIVKRFHFHSRFSSFQQIHLPETEASAEQAKDRFRFEELFFSQLRIVQLKVRRKQTQNGFVFTHLGNFFNRFYHEKLPFELTKAQKRVIKEIRADVLSAKQMNRLLQGDVGSGKTIVSFITMLMAIDNGYQSGLMVPTEILAQQHFRNLQRMTEGLGLKIGFLTSSVKGKNRKLLLQQLSNGELHLLVGTHALLEDQVVFQNLGLVVIDEQHRFGVEQRARLWTKNQKPPHVLVMTATPIPRTLAMTLYGDLDISVIDELPPGRKPVKTVHRDDSARLRVFGFMKEEIKKKRQIYVVYPLIEESETQDYKFLMDGYESITRAFPLPEFAVSIVHGKMKTDARDYEMLRFIRGETQIMVSTTVIEVGVDVPNASVMVIENAERFGLSQLHQLRGRVGRGADQSFCILMSGEKISSDGLARLNIMTQTNDGFRIAEEDMRLRGPGDIEGTQQSGLMPFKIADLARDQKWLILAREEAEKILSADPTLNKSQHTVIRNFIEGQKRNEKQWSRIS